MANTRIETLERAIDHAVTDSARSVTLLLTVCLVFLATIVETSHQDILLNTSKPLPQIGTRLPLIGIFTVVPLAIALLHLATLLQMRGLIVRMRELHRLVAASPDREQRLDGLPSSLLVQWVLSTRQRWTLSAALLSLLVALTLVFLPLGTLLAAQIRFLPYHAVEVTWLHRVLIGFDVLALATILALAPWRRVSAAPPDRLEPTRTWAAITGAFAAAVLFVSLAVATVPDEGVERALVAALPEPRGEEHAFCEAWTLDPRSLFAVKEVPIGAGMPDRQMLCLTYLLTENDDTGVAFMRRNLVVREAAIVAESPPRELIARVGEAEAWRISAAAVQVAGRDLRYADLTGTHLQGVNFRGADLRGARLFYSRLAYADFADIAASLVGSCPPESQTRWEDQTFCRSRLDGADLSHANLAGANLFKAQLRGVRLTRTTLHGAHIGRADFRHTDLRDMDFAGADLVGADFTGADLRGADLRGAVLDHAHLIDVDLQGARIDGASLRHARIALAAATVAAEIGNVTANGADLRDATLLIAPPDWLGASGDDATLWAALTSPTWAWGPQGVTPAPAGSPKAVPTISTDPELKSGAASASDVNYGELVRGVFEGADLRRTDLVLAGRLATLEALKGPPIGVRATPLQRLVSTRPSADATASVDRADELLLHIIDAAGAAFTPLAAAEEEALAALLIDLACAAGDRSLTLGIARRIAAASPRDQRYHRSGAGEAIRLHEYRVAQGLLADDCAGTAALSEARLCQLVGVERRWQRLDGATADRLPGDQRRPPPGTCVEHAT